MTGAGTARRRDGRITQERILEAAMAAIAEDGLASLTMAALAERLGTSGGHILYYFGSKDRLLLEALRWSETALAEERRALLGRRTTAERKLDQFMELYLPRGPRDPRWTVWIELWARTTGEGPLRAAQEELDRGWQTDLEALLAKGAAQGRFAIPEPEVPERADMLLALLDGLSTRVVLSQHGSDRASALRTARTAARRLVVDR
ncbi:TetR family transcriptional regulator [Streptomyces sp. CB03234]|uniref:TetR/AcrR family transcriptional regulator n=1 Tax=Streptomyces sp. (strain CB03234) TaxID=1703937 RepID=UPI000966D6BD|nr:TetR/AcrR family transcriptional regulator [Streptomyces sp. CB03234]OKK03773.1 TetR family transcriptional regulator [Streptomyces sp. CB03234]